MSKYQFGDYYGDQCVVKRDDYLDEVKSEREKLVPVDRLVTIINETEPSDGVTVNKTGALDLISALQRFVGEL